MSHLRAAKREEGSRSWMRIADGRRERETYTTIGKMLIFFDGGAIAQHHKVGSPPRISLEILAQRGVPPLRDCPARQAHARPRTEIRCT